MPLVTFSGLASGIDSDSLIQAMNDAARAARVKPWETRITELESTNTALEDLSTKLASLQSIIRGFASLYGGPVARQAVSSNESVITATASNAATNGSYSITVGQLAKNAAYTLAPNSGTWSSTSAVIDAAAGDNIVVTVGSGTYQETITVACSGTTTLSDFITAFNSQCSLATASAVNVGTASAPDYRLMIVSHNEGTEKGAISINSGTVAVTSTGQDAADAQFTVAGISGAITRQSNTVSDLIPGLTFQLNSVSATAATVSVGTDADTTYETAKKFVDAFNEIVKFVSDNNKIERTEKGDKITNTFGTLAKTRVDDSVLSSLRSAIAGAKADHTGQIAIFSDLGITTQRDGTLRLDETTFKKALAADPAAVAEIMQNFADETALTGGTIDQYIRFNGLIDLTVNANKTSITGMNERIARAEEMIQKTADMTKRRFTALEQIMAKMQTQQQSLVQALGLNAK